MTRTAEAILETRQLRRMRAEDKFLAAIDRKEEKAEAMIGELNSGKLYIFPVGGKYREGTRGDLVRFLIRNHYV